MTIAAAEVAEGAAGGAEGAAGGAAVRSPGRPAAGSRTLRGRQSSGRGSPGRTERRTTVRERSSSRDRSTRIERDRSGGGGSGNQGSAGNQDGQVPGLSGTGSYHRVVIAEFIVVIILIGMSPFLRPRTSTSGSPSAEATAAAAATSLAGPLVRLTAACIVFFALALLSTGRKTGKIAAAVGGLIVLGTLLNATDMFTALGQLFGLAAKTPAPKPASTGSA